MMSPGELAKRHAKKQAVSKDVRSCLGRLITRLVKKYPAHTDVIMTQLEGEWQRLLSEREENKKSARQRTARTNGSV